jgi:uncharacterized membrane protein YkoI
MKYKRMLIAGAAAAALAAGGAAIAGAAGGDDESGPDDRTTEKAITGPALERAGRVALDRVGGGRVTATEIGDEEGYYEVEVTRPGGDQVDVHLDRRFRVIDATTDER